MENGLDIWLDKGCEFLGGGCMRWFVKGNGEKFWCVFIVLDEKGIYVLVVCVGMIKCCIKCD